MNSAMQTMDLNTLTSAEYVRETLAAMRQRRCHLALAITGGGSGAIGHLLRYGGASSVVMDAVVPYGNASLLSYLGARQLEGAATRDTALAMAMAAYLRCRALRVATEAASSQHENGASEDAVVHDAAGGGAMDVGVSLTAALPTNRTRRGEDRIHVALQTRMATRLFDVHLEKHAMDREAAERLAEQLVLLAVQWSYTDITPALAQLDATPGIQRVEHRTCIADRHLPKLLEGQSMVWCFADGQELRFADAPALPMSRVSAIFPGSFNPPHRGHRGMMRHASARLGRAPVAELSLHNVDKPPLDYVRLYDRLRGVFQELKPSAIAITDAPLFQQKAALLPGVPIIVGADTVIRIDDPKYYNDDVATRDRVLSEMRDEGTQFMAFGRLVDGAFRDAQQLPLSTCMRDMILRDSPQDYREDVSSTEIRDQVSDD
ncbi:MAG: hypothetical protein AAFP90_07000 [Planctomycetota bacterium]